MSFCYRCNNIKAPFKQRLLYCSLIVPFGEVVITYINFDTNCNIIRYFQLYSYCMETDSWTSGPYALLIAKRLIFSNEKINIWLSYSMVYKTNAINNLLINSIDKHWLWMGIMKHV